MSKERQFRVTLYELHTADYTVEASSLAEAIDKVSNGDGTYRDVEYDRVATDEGYGGVSSIEDEETGVVVYADSIQRALDKEQEETKSR